MSQMIFSYVLRIFQENGDAAVGQIRIRLKHVQTDEELYFTSMAEVKEYIEQQIQLEMELKS